MFTIDLSRRRVLIVSDQSDSPLLRILSSIGLRRVRRPADLAGVALDDQELLIAESSVGVLAALFELQTQGMRTPVILAAHPQDFPEAVRLRTEMILPADAGTHDIRNEVRRVLESLDGESRVRDLVRRVDRGLAKLNQGQRQVLERLLCGLSNKQVAQELGVGLRTVEARRARCMEVLKAGSFAELVGETTLHHYFSSSLPEKAWALMSEPGEVFAEEGAR